MIRRLSWSAARISGQAPPRRLGLLSWTLVAGLLLAACSSPLKAPPLTSLQPPVTTKVSAPALAAVPGSFPFPIEQNLGQAGPSVGYLLRAGSMRVGFGAGELTYVLSGSRDLSGVGSAGWRPGSPEQPVSDGADRAWSVRQELVGASRAMPSGTVGSPTTVSYFKGPSEQWLVSVPAFQQIAYAEAWPGITVTYDHAAGGMKSVYHVAAGAAPEQIRLLYSGARVHINEVGVLVAETPLGELRESPPIAWQDRDGARELVAARFEILSEPTADEVEYGFALGAYDAGLPLVIDPQVAYASYIGGAGGDQGRAITVDGSGNVYVTGLADAPGVTFPGGPATFDNSHNGDWDAFVAKLNPAGTGLVYASFIGGTGQEIGFGVAVDGTGNAYIAGLSGSSEATFPTGSGVGVLTTFDGTFNNGGGDAFVAKVNPAGTALVYAGYVGGSGYDQASGIAIDGAGNAYISGYTDSSAATFPDGDGMGGLATVDGTYNGGGGDGFIAKVNAAGTALVYASYVGGSGLDQAYGVAVDGSGNAYLTGRVGSSEVTFPGGSGMGVLTTFDGTFNGGDADAFLVKVNPAGTALVYAGYVGGSGLDYAYGVAVNGAGNAFLTGPVSSTESTFPAGSGMGSLTTFDGSFNGGEDTFVVKVNPAGTALVYAGYIGGSGVDVAAGITVDGTGNVYVAGGTTSTETTFPTGSGMGALPTFDGLANSVGDGFVAKVNAAGKALLYAGFLGGNGVDSNPPWSTELGIAIAVDPSGNVYVTGRTNSNEVGFPDGLGISGLPTFDGAFGGGLTDASVVKVAATSGCPLAGRQAAPGLAYAMAAPTNAYYDYVSYGSTNSFYSLVYLYQASLNSQAGSTAHANGDYATAKTNFNAAATYAYYGYQYAYASYASTGSLYAYYASEYGYYAWFYEHQADVNC